MTLLPGGSLLAGIIAAWLLPFIGWRGVFVVGLSPLSLVLMIRYWVPESPRVGLVCGWADTRKRAGRRLGVDGRPERDRAADADAAGGTESTRWLDLFKYPKAVAAGTRTG